MEDEIIFRILDFFGSIYHSSFFFVLKLFLAVYLIVLFIDIVLLFILKGTSSDIRSLLRGTNMPVVSKSQMQKRWQKIISRLESENPSQYKVAVLEADILIDEVLAKSGLPGANLTERLEKIQPNQLVNYNDLQQAHKIRNDIIHKENYQIDKKRAFEVLKIYEKTLRSFELL